MIFENWLQSRLTSHGFPVGAIDGKIGPVTRAAIRAFQSAKGLPVTGLADDATVKMLRATSTGDGPRPADPDVTTLWPRQPRVPIFYGKVGVNQTQIDIPYDMFLAWNKSVRIRKMTLHTKVAASALRVLEKTVTLYSSQEREALGLHLFGGSLNVRKMRGGASWSMHSWGIAIDFDPERNALHTRAPAARLSHSDALPFWQAWEAEGWVSLGRAKDFDWMHIQAARL